MTSIQAAILSTIIYYDALDYPLTSFEIFKYLVNPERLLGGFNLAEKEISLVNIIEELDKQSLKKFVSQKNGFYFLKSREVIIRTRIKRQKIADQKWEKARRVIRWLQVVPFLRMVAISGSLALNNTKPESDFDVLLVVKSKRIWLSRLLVTALIQIMGRRRYKKFTKDRVCLNHYVTDQSLKIEFESLYNAQTYAHLVPVLKIKDFYFKSLSSGAKTEDGLEVKFQEANDWIKKYLARYPQIKNQSLKFIKNNFILGGLGRFLEIILSNKFGDYLEKMARRIEEPLIKNNPLTYQKGGRVTADDSQLEFHPQSPEKKVIDRYNSQVATLGVKKIKAETDSGLI